MKGIYGLSLNTTVTVNSVVLAHEYHLIKKAGP